MPTLPILYVDSRSQHNREAVTLLDGAGVSYQLKDVRQDTAAAAALQRGAPDRTLPVLQWGRHFLADFNRQQLGDFLLARGAKLEDS